MARRGEKPPAAPNLEESAPPLEETAPNLENGNDGDDAPDPTAGEKRAARQAVVDEETRQAEQALATLDDVGSSDLMPFAPATFNAAWKLAWHLSKSGIVSQGLQGNAGAVLSVMARGAYLGIPWAIAVQEAHVVHGKVGWPASVLAAICDTSPTFEYFEVVEADNEHAVVEAKKPRWTEPQRYEVTLEDANAMGFMDGKHSKLWTSKRPMPMLVAMARREAARLWDPARCAGIYTPDELEATRSDRQLSEAPGAKTAELARRLGAGNPPAVIAAPAELEAAPEREPEPDPTGRPMLDARQVETILETLERKPKIERSQLEEEWGGPLEEIQGNEGETSAAFYTRVLESIRDLKRGK